MGSFRYKRVPSQGGPAESRPWRCSGGAAPLQLQDGEADSRNLRSALRYFGEAELEGGVAADLCCGNGLMARRFAQTGRFDLVFATDMSWPALESARAAAEAESVGPDSGLLLAHADVESLPFCEDALDFAWWGKGLHLVDDTEAAMSSIFASLRPGGRLLGTCSERVAMDRLREVDLSVEEIERLLTGAGFVGVEVAKPEEHLYAFRGLRPSARLSNILGF